MVLLMNLYCELYVKRKVVVENTQPINSLIAKVTIFLRCVTEMPQQMRFNVDCGHTPRTVVSFLTASPTAGLIILIIYCLYLFFPQHLFHLKLAMLLHSNK